VFTLLSKCTNTYTHYLIKKNKSIYSNYNFNYYSMRQKFYSLLMLIMALCLPASCSYDDTDVWNAVNGLDERVSNLEELVNTLNNNVSTLQGLMSGKLFIQSVEDQGNGVRIVHLVSDSGTLSTIEIKDGKDGQDGQDGVDGTNGKDGQDGKDGVDGKDGKDGVDGTTPLVSVRQDTDGNWYWTVNGEWLIVDGQKVRANGIDGINGTNGTDGTNGKDGKDGVDGKDGKDGVDGKDGADGKDGKDGADGQDGKDGSNGIAPAFKIENDKWYVSLDRGITWTELGDAKGADGDSFFKDASVSDNGKIAYLTLADGTVLALPIYSEFGIAFDVSTALVMPGQTKQIDFVVTGMTSGTIVEAIGKEGWKAETKLNSDGTGYITVTAPDTTCNGIVIVFASDGADKTIMRTLSFVAGVVNVSTSAIETTASGGSYNVDVETNLEFTIEVPDDAANWIKVVGGRAYELRTESFTISVAQNTSPDARVAQLKLISDGKTVESIAVVQAGETYNPERLVFRVDPAQVTSNPDTYGVRLPLYQVSKGGKVYVDWGDGSEVQTLNPVSATSTLLSTTDRYPYHLYTDKTREYSVQVWGDLTNISGTSATYVQGIVGIVQWGTSVKYANISLTAPLIKTLPGVVDNEFSALTTMTFTGCTALTSVSPNLLKGAEKLQTISKLFYNCTQLEELPKDLFEDCKDIRNCQNAFSYCKSLRNIPAMTATVNTGTPSVLQMCQYCESLTDLPDQMWPEAFASRITNINSMFQGCTSLERVPDNFFKGLGEGTTAGKTIAVTIANYLFQNCTSLKHVNLETLFNKPGTLQIYSFAGTFENCSNLEGTVPSYAITAGETTYNVAPWERATYNNSEDATLKAASQAAFGTRTSYTSAKCFTNCKKLTNYEDIPSTWGGEDVSVKAAPTIKLSASLPSGEEYYAVDFNLKGTYVQSAKYYLSTPSSIEALLPKYGNSLEQLTREIGVEIGSSYNEAINSEQGLTLGWEGGMPSVEYALVVRVENTLGNATAYITKSTTAMPKGSDEYEAYVGTWIVTSDDATSEIVADSVPVSTFEVTIVPNRVDKNYAVYGWGNTIFNQRPFMWLFNSTTKALEVWNGSTGVTNVLQGYEYSGEGAKYTSYNVIYYPYLQDDSGNFSYWSSGSSDECILAGNYLKSSDKVVLHGQRSESNSTSTVDVNWVGIEVALAMGSQGGSQVWTPVDIIREGKRFVYQGKEYTPYHLAPYTMVRKTEDVSTTVARVKKAAVSTGKSLRVSKISGKNTAATVKAANAQKFSGKSKIKAKAKKRKTTRTRR
jgi:hypothetical protein